MLIALIKLTLDICYYRHLLKTNRFLEDINSSTETRFSICFHFILLIANRS
jgi:hypothetical protein